jgi:hypothetical protein
MHRPLELTVPVTNYVGRIEQRGISQPAHRAPMLVRMKHAGAEHGLVKALARDPFDVLALRVVAGVADAYETLCGVEGRDELKL